MKKQRTYLTISTLITLGLFLINLTPALAQVIEVEVIGGGYRIGGPETMSFPGVGATYANNQVSEVDLEDLNTPIIIRDDNGGNNFQLNVQSDTCYDSGLNSSSITMEVKNSATVLSYQGSYNITAANTSSFSSITGTPVVLATGTGESPGRWGVSPTFRMNIPAGTLPETYSCNVIFTII